MLLMKLVCPSFFIVHYERSETRLQILIKILHYEETVFIMAMSVCAFMAQAQTTSGIRVGLNMTSATGKYNDLMADQDYNNKSYMGYSVHYFIDVPVIGNFSIQPAIGLSMKGITYEYDKFTTKNRIGSIWILIRNMM